MQGLVQRGMVVAASGYVVENGHDALGFPFDGYPVLLPWLAITQRPGLRRDFAQHPVGRQCIHHVAQHRVVDAVAYKADHIVVEQLTHKTCCPALCEIGQAEITAGDHQTAQGRVVHLFG